MTRSRQVSKKLSSMGSHATIAIIGMVAENEFEKARLTLKEFSEYCDYDDYRAMRESLQVGLAMSGLHTAMLNLSLSDLVLWREVNCQSAGYAHDLWIDAMIDIEFE